MIGTRLNWPLLKASRAVRVMIVPSMDGKSGTTPRMPPWCEHLIDRERTQALRGLVGAPGQGGEFLAELEGRCRRRDPDARSALVDRAVKQPFRCRRNQVRHHRGAAARLPEDRHVAGIAAECGDIRLHPAQCELLVHDAVVRERMAFGIDGGMREEPQRADAIVERDHDHAAAAGELAAVVIVALAAEQAAAVKPHHDRKARPGLRFGSRREHVEIEAVFGLARRREHAALGLRAGVSELRRVQRLRPPCRRLRRPPAKLADRRFGIGNTEKL
jgi:hypothetical protein